ncbi:unnamed protein product [Musa hybrid cultivar]
MHFGIAFTVLLGTYFFLLSVFYAYDKMSFVSVFVADSFNEEWS